MNILDTPAKTPLYLDLYWKLRGRIESGEYPVGSRIPSEKDISEENGVSRITTKHALEQLVNEGFVKRFPGKGTFVQSCTGAVKRQPELSPVPAAVQPKLIGVVMEGFSPDYGGGILMGIEQKCAELGYSAIVKFSYGDEARESECIRELLAAGVKGIVLMCVYSETYSPSVMKLSLEGFPLVFVDRCLKGLPVPYVGTDHQEAARQLTDELLRQGHEHLAFAMFDDTHTTSSAMDRMNGYVDSCLKHNLLCGSKRLLLSREGIIYREFPEKRTENEQKIRQFLQENPETTAVLAVSARVGIIVMESAAGTGVRTVASFDGPQYAYQTPCDLMYVVQDQLLMGNTACEHLISRINGQEVPNITYIPYRLNS